MENSFFYPGGMHGHNINQWLGAAIGKPGVLLVLFVVAILFLICISNETIIILRKILHPNFKKSKKDDILTPESQNEPIVFEDPEPAKTIEFDDFEKNKEDDEIIADDAEDIKPIIKPEKTVKPAKVVDTTGPDFEVTNKIPNDDKYRGKLTEPYNPRLDLENYRFPKLDLLNPYDDNRPDINMEEQTDNKNRIIEVLRSFGIEINSIKATVGPTITLYEITPAEGVRISKIRNLENDIALNLAALGIRIIAPIPGRERSV